MIAAAAAFLAFLVVGFADAREAVIAKHFMVAAAHPLAAQAGARLLAQGGNAFDAAAATAAALNVVEPYMSGLAGAGLATCWAARTGRSPDTAVPGWGGWAGSTRRPRTSPYGRGSGRR